MPASQVKKAHLAKCQRCRRATFLRRKLRGVVFRNAPMEPSFRCMVGCDRGQLRQHLESLFEPWMNRENYCVGKNRWTIGHRMPCASYRLVEFAEDCRAFNHANLFPRDFTENSRLGACPAD